MPDDQGRPFAEDIAARIGITVSDWRARVSRGYAPKVADRVVHDGAVRSVWDPAEVDAYVTARQARLSANHPHTDPGDGRTKCDLCGKFVWLVTHSCKRVPVTPAAIARYNEGRPAHEQIGSAGAV
jgi:hypothetical protein